MTPEPAVTYRSVLGNREFLAILLSQTLSILGDQVARLALAFVIYERTQSAFAASASYAVSYLTYLVGGPLLSTLSDRYTRRTVMVVSDVGRAAVVLLLALVDVNVAGIFVLIVVLGAFAPAFDSARGATLPDILPGEAYPRGSALAITIFQAAQVAGFLLGGALLAGPGTQRALLLDASTFVVSALVLITFMKARFPAEKPAKANIFQETAEGFRVVFWEPKLRRLLSYALLGAMAVSSPESLAIPVAQAKGGGSLAAGVLTASIPAGFIVASFLVLRLPPSRRTDLLPLLVVVSVVPLMLTPFAGGVALTVALWTVSGFGSSLQLVASAAYVAAAPVHARGRAYGLASTCLMATQGLAQLGAGALASAWGSPDGPGVSIALLALLTLVLLPLVSGFARRSRTEAQGTAHLVR